MVAHFGGFSLTLAHNKYRLTKMANHPNRGRNRGTSANPDPEEIRTLRTAANLTQAEAAAMVHTTGNVWQQWETPRDQKTEGGSPSSRRMHPAFWELFQMKVAALAKVKTK